GGGLAELQLVGGAGVIQAVKAAQYPQGGHIPETCQVVDMNGATQAVFAGVIVAAVVGVNAAGDPSARGDIHNQVRRPHRSTRYQGRFDIDTVQVREQQKPVFQGFAIDDVAAVEAVQQ